MTPDARLVVLTDVELLLVLLWGECRGESLAAQLAVAASVRNRVTSGKWFGGNYHQVILRYAQFSCLWPKLGGVNFERVLTFASKVQARMADGPVERQLAWVAQGTVDGALHEDTARRATHYYDLSIQPPAWAKAPAQEVVAVDHLRFWADVA